jgi:hypothetical protein
MRTAADGASASTAPNEAPSPPLFAVVFEEANGTRTLMDVQSGEILRDVMLEAEPPIDLYTTWCAKHAPQKLQLSAQLRLRPGEICGHVWATM